MQDQEKNTEYSISKGIEIKKMFLQYLENYVLYKYNILQNKYKIPKFTKVKISYSKENPVFISYELLHDKNIISIEALLLLPENIKTIQNLSNRDKTFYYQKCQHLSKLDERYFITYFLTNVIYSTNYNVFNGFIKQSEKCLISDLEYEIIRNELLDILYDVLVMFEK